MNLILIVPKITARLSYITDFIFTRELGISYELRTEPVAQSEASLMFNYGSPHTHLLNIPNSGLVFEEGIKNQEIDLGDWEGLPVLFPIAAECASIPFDIFSAVFFLISRYEEYLPFTPDKHNRFPATESVLYKYDLLQRPVVDEWIFAFGALLQSYGLNIQKSVFQFLPTYDIDIAWSYKNKGLKRTLGGYLKDVADNNFVAVQERTSVLCGNKKDPYDSFEFTDELHKRHKLKPLYFILAASKNGPFDKHILPHQTEMRTLIQSLSEQYKIGTHPSYHSSDHLELFAEEQNILQHISGQSIDISRQHYIKFTFPETYRHLISIGIHSDYSMGYGTHLGFRAGTSKPFLWYDLSAEQQTQLNVFPFSFMDTTAHYEEQLSADNAFAKLKKMREKLQSIGGLLITVFHNFSLGTDQEWKGWQAAYEDFIKHN